MCKIVSEFVRQHFKEFKLYNIIVSEFVRQHFKEFKLYNIICDICRIRKDVGCAKHFHHVNFSSTGGHRAFLKNPQYNSIAML